MINGEVQNAKDLFTIDCKDIVLREYNVNDLDPFYALTWQPEIYEFLPSWNVSKEKRKHWLLNYEIKENKEIFRGG